MPLPKPPYPCGFQQKPDENDAKFPVSLLLAAPSVPRKRPMTKAWRHGPVLDQGPTSSCVGHACWQLMASEPVVNDRLKEISPFVIYNEARKIDEWQGENYEGTSIRAGLNVLRGWGVIRQYYWASTVEEVVDHLLKIGPMVFGTDWNDGMENPTPDGFVTPRGASKGGHAYFAHTAHLRYHDRSKEEKEEGASLVVDFDKSYILFLNSWSQGWGANGHFRASLSTVKQLLAKGGVAAAVTE